MFGKTWMRENGFTEESLQHGNNMAVTFGVSFVLALIASYNLAAFIGMLEPMMAIFVSFLTGAGWVATSIGMHYLFERRTLKLFFINAGFSTVSFIIMGAIIGYWK